MIFIKWTPKYSVGIEEIDKQHKILMEMINDSYELSKKETDDKKLKMIISDLLEYTRVHFSTEERYFKKWDYPYSEEHMIAHEEMILKVLEFAERFKTEKSKIIPDLLNFFKYWLENHIQIYDFKYANYFRDHGLI